MIFDVIFKKADKIIEESVRVEINGLEFECFSSFHEGNMQEGKVYKAELELEIFEELRITESHSKTKGLFKPDSSFAYILKGFLKENMIDVGFDIKLDWEDLDGYYALDGKYVEISGVDRIYIDFIY